MTIYKLVLSCFLLYILHISCTADIKEINTISYTTTSDSTLYYYNLGWQQIMDLGLYGQAEISYRKAIDFDNDFLIGKATLARLTLDQEERLLLFQNIEKDKSNISGDERKILDVYQGLVHFTNVREQSPEKSRNVIDSVLIIAEQNLRYIVDRYPDEIYLKSEYIEILHSSYGAQVALDSLDKLCTDTQKENPFLLGFAASLNAREGRYDDALKKAKQLKYIINNPNVPKIDAVYADVYLQMDSLSLAKIHADRAVILDPRNLDASRLQTRIEHKLNN